MRLLFSSKLDVPPNPWREMLIGFWIMVFETPHAPMPSAINPLTMDAPADVHSDPPMLLPIATACVIPITQRQATIKMGTHMLAVSCSVLPDKE